MDAQTMPAGAVRFEGAAGEGLLMDLRTWHSALPPTQAAGAGQREDRAGLIIQVPPL
jgi:hypothetical protein